MSAAVPHLEFRHISSVEFYEVLEDRRIFHPIVNGVTVHLYTLFCEVTSRGGIRKLTEHGFERLRRLCFDLHEDLFVDGVYHEYMQLLYPLEEHFLLTPNALHQMNEELAELDSPPLHAHGVGPSTSRAGYFADPSSDQHMEQNFTLDAPASNLLPPVMPSADPEEYAVTKRQRTVTGAAAPTAHQPQWPGQPELPPSYDQGVATQQKGLDNSVSLATQAEHSSNPNYAPHHQTAPQNYIPTALCTSSSAIMEQTQYYEPHAMPQQGSSGMLGGYPEAHGAAKRPKIVTPAQPSGHQHYNYPRSREHSPPQNKGQAGGN